MSSELRVNKLTSRSGVGTVTFNDSGLIITGIATAATLDITGNATIAGVLSYDDVTNVDSVGLVTARSGIKVGATGSNTLISGTATGIGIGTESPDRKLEVVNDNDYALKVGGNTAGGYYLELGQTGTNGSAGIKYSGSGGSLKISNSSGEIARFDPSGNMGIGEETPDVRLHVKETINVAYSVANATSDANNLLKLENPSTTANAFAGVQFRTGNGADMYFGAIQQSANAGDFFFANQNSPSVEIMRIKSTGDVTIGNSSVAFPSGGGLQVYNASAPRIKLTNSTTGVASGDGFQIYLSGSSAILDQKENAEMRFYTNATEKVRITSAGILQLDNGNQITAADTTTYLGLGGGNSTSNGANIFLYGGSHASNASVFLLRTGTSESLRVDSSGYLKLSGRNVQGTTNGDKLLRIYRHQEQMQNRMYFFSNHIIQTLLIL